MSSFVVPQSLRLKPNTNPSHNSTTFPNEYKSPQSCYVHRSLTTNSSGNVPEEYPGKQWEAMSFTWGLEWEREGQRKSRSLLLLQFHSFIWIPVWDPKAVSKNIAGTGWMAFIYFIQSKVCGVVVVPLPHFLSVHFQSSHRRHDSPIELRQTSPFSHFSVRDLKHLCPVPSVDLISHLLHNGSRYYGLCGRWASSALPAVIFPGGSWGWEIKWNFWLLLTFPSSSRRLSGCHLNHLPVTIGQRVLCWSLQQCEAIYQTFLFNCKLRDCLKGAATAKIHSKWELK